MEDRRAHEQELELEGEQQALRLVGDRPPGRRQSFRLDERTREIGRRGLAEARAALEEAIRRSAA